MMCLWPIVPEIAHNLSMLLFIRSKGTGISWMPQRRIRLYFCFQKAHSPVTNKQIGPYTHAQKVEQRKDGGRDEMFWHRRKGSQIGLGCLGIISHKHQWLLILEEKYVGAIQTEKVRRNFPRKGNHMSLCLGPEEQKSETQRTTGSCHRGRPDCLLGQVLRMGIEGERVVNNEAQSI